LGTLLLLIDISRAAASGSGYDLPGASAISILMSPGFIFGYFLSSRELIPIQI
jgi:hypothetical protein